MNLYFEFADPTVKQRGYPSRYGRITGLPDKIDPMRRVDMQKFFDAARVWRETSEGVVFLKNRHEPVWGAVDMREFLTVVLAADEL